MFDLKIENISLKKEKFFFNFSKRLEKIIISKNKIDNIQIRI
tara:strand:+ start:1078 stop:1203 length:126 start_codon:yes stop_codon:yes gene_type:complete